MNKRENFEEESSIAEIVRKLKVKEVEKVRRESRNEDFKLLAEIGIVPMIPKETWKRNHTSVEISTLVTVADEAFALLCMENNVYEWIKTKIYGKDAVSKGEYTIYTSPEK